MKLTCDLCGGALEMKNGSAVCTQCGLTYSMETLREKMGKPAPAPAPQQAAPAASVASDSTSQIRYLLNLAKIEINNKSFHKAASLCDQVLAADYSNAEAWQMKIRCENDDKQLPGLFQSYYASQQTAAAKEQAVAFANTNLLSHERGVDPKLASAILPISPNAANTAAKKVIEKQIANQTSRLNKIAEAQNWEKNHKPSTENERNENTREFSQNIINWGNYLSSYEVEMVKNWYQFAQEKGSDIDSELFNLCDVMLKWINAALSFQYWCGEFHRRETVSVYTTKYYYHKYKLMPLFYDTSLVYDQCSKAKTAIQSIHSMLVKMNEQKTAQRAAAEKKRIADYWADHPEEKQELETAKVELQAKISKLESKFCSSPEKQMEQQLEKELKTLQSKRDSLGLFSFKEKKALDQQINDTQIEILRARTKCDDLQYQINNQIKELKFKILKINDRLMLHGEKPKL